MTKNSFTNVIEQLYNHKSIAEIYAYSHDSDKFAVGIVIDYSLEEVVIKANYVDSPLIANYSHPFISAIDYSDKFDDENIPF